MYPYKLDLKSGPKFYDNKLPYLEILYQTINNLIVIFSKIVNFLWFIILMNYNICYCLNYNTAMPLVAVIKHTR